MGTCKKVSLLLLVVLLLTPLSLACQPAAPAEAQTIKFSLAHIYTPKSWNEVYAVPALFQLVEKQTKGKYKLDIAYYPAGSLLASADIFGGVTKGIADIGWANPGINPGLFPVMTTLSQPGIAPAENAYANAHTWWDFYNKFKPKEFADVKVLLWAGVGPGFIHSKKPIRSVQDFKGLKVRVIGPGVEAIKALGAEPVGLPSGDIYLSAQKGIIDAALIPMGAVETFKLDEVLPFSTSVPPLYNEGKYCVMNQAKWNSLPKDLQDAFAAVANDAVDLDGRIWSYYDPLSTIDRYLPKTHTVIYLPESEMAKLVDVTRPIRNTYTEELNKKGFPGGEMVTEAGKITEKYNKAKYEPWAPPAK